jgi:carbon-monoxide dehydrogenase small subunit
MTRKISMTVNGQPDSHEVPERTFLVQYLRESCRLTGTHVGCDTAQCGACTVHLNGRAIKSCNVLALQAEGAEVATIESVAGPGGTLHPVQQAFRDQHGLQCGYCTPGMVMSTLDLLKHKPKPSATEIREQLEGNLCRCTGYHNIVKAVQQASQVMAES